MLLGINFDKLIVRSLLTKMNSCKARGYEIGQAICRARTHALHLSVVNQATRYISVSTVTRATQESTVDAWVAEREARKQLAAAVKPPVPVSDGEYLLYTGGGSTKRNLIIQNTMPTFLYIYALSIGSLADKIDSVLGMKPLTVSGGAAVFATIMSVLAYAGSKSAVKAAVLTKDGHHIRFHTYGPFLGLGYSKPVTVPIRLLKHSSSTRVSKAGADALYVSVKDSENFLTFDKPNLLQLLTAPGTGLTFSKKGVVTIQTGKSADGTATLMPPSALYELAPEQREQFRRYALLAHVLGGHPVNMQRVLDGSWELDHMVEQLDVYHGKTSKEQRVEDLKYWRKAVDAKNGRDYWWHTLTWQRQWAAPSVEGKEPEIASAAMH